MGGDTATRGLMTDLASKGPNGLHSLEYYGKCMIGGLLACGITHLAVLPLDVAKCRAQAHSKSGRWPKGLIPGIARTATEEGLRGLVKGWAPTGLGYGAQGAFKFGFNELFKDIYGKAIGGEEKLDAKWKKIVFWAVASASGEFFGDIVLCPLEMTKVKMQVTLPGTDGGFPSKFLPAIRQMNANRADTRFPFGSLAPLWGRQIPYTSIKFVVFYQTIEAMYNHLEANYGIKKADMSQPKQLVLTFLAGYWAGIFCAIATQPMDNLVSMKGIPENKNKSWGTMAAEMGAKDLFMRGLGTRVLMIGTLSAGQWWIYGSFKSISGFGTC